LHRFLETRFDFDGFRVQAAKKEKFQMEKRRESRMKPRHYRLFCAAVMTVCLLLKGCAYSHGQMPLEMDFDRTRLGPKTGRAHSHSVLWLVACGDAGTRAAAEEGGITLINHADIAVTVVLFGLYGRRRLIIYGD
jgi:hypothetical protein